MIRSGTQVFLRRGVLALALPLLLAALPGCGDDGSGPSDDPFPDDYDTFNPVVYSQHVQKVFTVSCNTAACHNDADDAAGLRLTTYTALAQGSSFGGQVVPFRPDRSPLYLHMTGEIQPLMPLALDPLRDDILRMFKRWIEAGAPNDAGQVMYSNVTKKAFVACQGENAVAALDLDSGLLVRLLTIDQPHSVFVDAANDRLYVTRFENASNNIQMYDANTYELLDFAQGGTFPALLGIPPGKNQLWVTNFDTGASPDNAVRILDPTTLDEIDSFSLPISQPHGLAFSPDGSLVYVSNIGSSDISIFTTNPLGVDEGSIPLPTVAGIPNQQPQQCVISPDGSRLYVSALGSDRVHVFRTDTRDWGTSVEVGDAPWHLALSPQTNELWVANWIGESVSILSLVNPDAPVQVAELRPNRPLNPSLPAFERPIGISLRPGTNFMYVANANDDGTGQGHHPPPDGQKNPGSVTTLNVLTRTVVRVDEVPNFARFVAFLP